MADPLLGFNRGEIVSKVLDSLGRTGDTTLQDRLRQDINLAQLDYWKMTDWRFGMRNGTEDGMSITLVSGVSNYMLDTAEIGEEMRNTDIDKIFCITPGYARTLVKETLRAIRTWDPQRQRVGMPEFYANDSLNRIEVWPIPDDNVDGLLLYIDGKVMPTYMQNDSDYPDIPIEYQSSFIQFLLCRALSRERDPRHTEELQILQNMMAQDGNYELKEVENHLRIKWPEEEYTDGNLIPDLKTAMWYGLWYR